MKLTVFITVCEPEKPLEPVTRSASMVADDVTAFHAGAAAKELCEGMIDTAIEDYLDQFHGAPPVDDLDRIIRSDLVDHLPQ